MTEKGYQVTSVKRDRWNMCGKASTGYAVTAVKDNKTETVTACVNFLHVRVR